MKLYPSSLGGIVVGITLATTIALGSPRIRTPPDAAEDIRGVQIGLCGFLFAVLSFGAFASLQQERHRRSTEKSLRNSECRAGTVLETAVDTVISIDERGTIEVFNHAAERMLRYSRDEVRQSSPERLSHRRVPKLANSGLVVERTIADLSDG